MRRYKTVTIGERILTFVGQRIPVSGKALGERDAGRLRGVLWKYLENNFITLL